MSDLLNRIDLRFDFVGEKLSNYEVSSSGCWEYQGQIRNAAYGYFTIYVNGFSPQKRKFSAHRVAYAYHNGVDPGALLVCHKCDNPRCINPEHLFLGAAKDNTQDMISKGRAADQKGGRNGAAKITDETALEVIALIKAGRNNKQIAASLPVTHSMVSLIRLGKAWAHLHDKANYDPAQYRVFTRKAA